MSFAGKTIFIADSHLTEREEECALFFRMLDSFRKDPPAALVFLGDIFELWIALGGYETPLQRKFRAFCREAGASFPVYFIEGNHEFFPSSTCRKDFSFVDAGSLPFGKNALLIHGDTVNRADWKYASLRILTRNPVSRLLLRLFALCGGGKLVHKIRLLLKPTNKTYKTRFPREEFAAFLESLSGKKKVKTLFTGHFHSCHFLESSGIKVYTIPAWDTEKALIGVWDEEKESLEILSFHKLNKMEKS